MRVAVRAMLLWTACVSFGGCGGEGMPEDDATESIRMEISLAGDVCGVTSADAYVSAVDVAIGLVPLHVSDTAIHGRLSSVPAGPRRMVQVTAYNAYRRPVYSGSTVVDVVAGQVVSARLVLARDTQNCPGGPTGGIDIVGVLDTGTPIDAGTPRDGGAFNDPGVPIGLVMPVDDGTPMAFNDPGDPIGFIMPMDDGRAL